MEGGSAVGEQDPKVTKQEAPATDAAPNVEKEGEEEAKQCVECEDQVAEVECLDCEEFFCRPCRDQQHRKGKRRHHKFRPLLGKLVAQGMGTVVGQPEGSASAEHTPSNPEATRERGASDEATTSPLTQADVDKHGRVRVHASDMYRENVRYVPLRLMQDERIKLRVLEGALRVSEYTDKVDVRTWNKDAIIKEEIQEIMELIVGLYGCNNFRGTTALASRDMGENLDFFQEIFEIGRRYKTMNPDKMRTTYGKLLHMLQDAAGITIKRELGFDFSSGIKTVYSFLEERDALTLLEDDDLLLATQDTSLVDSAGEARSLVSERSTSFKRLIENHASANLRAEDIERVVNSITDSNNYQAATGGLVLKMIKYLKTYFSIDSCDEHSDLSISYGRGSKLSHTHSQQYTYVLQTLTLWLEITQQMFYLWWASDQDMLRPGNRYVLCNTGQGLNRMQSCPTVSKAMHSILATVQRRCGRWVGLSVVHLGDRDVPNALFFIDKYTQVPRMLGPIVQTLERMDELASNPSTKKFIASYGSPQSVRRMLLRNFFRNAFNGDGDDGGSCIDGRLTSAWNWCSKLEKNPFYRVYMLAGFQGFDGSFAN